MQTSRSNQTLLKQDTHQSTNKKSTQDKDKTTHAYPWRTIRFWFEDIFRIPNVQLKAPGIW